MLAFDHEAACWSWDLDRIHAKGYTDNVVDHMIMKLERLPADTQMALQQLAFIRNTGDVTTLSIVLERSRLTQLSGKAYAKGLIEQMDGTYKFIHDRVVEAAYSLIPEASRAEAHLRIA